MKKLMLILALMIAGLGATGAGATDVTVSFSDDIKAELQRLNELERTREAYFREYKVEHSRVAKVVNFDTAYYEKTQFAGARLVPNIADYRLDVVIRQLVLRGLEKVSGDKRPARIEVQIDRMHAPEYQLLKYRAGRRARVKGTIRLLDEKGTVYAEKALYWSLTRRYTNDKLYDGPDYLYHPLNASRRFEPALAAFIEKGLESLFPDTDVPGPIILRRVRP